MLRERNEGVPVTSTCLETVTKFLHFDRLRDAFARVMAVLHGLKTRNEIHG